MTVYFKIIFLYKCMNKLFNFSGCGAYSHWSSHLLISPVTLHINTENLYQTTGSLSCVMLQVMLNGLKFIARYFASSQCGFHFPACTTLFDWLLLCMADGCNFRMQNSSIALPPLLLQVGRGIVWERVGVRVDAKEEARKSKWERHIQRDGMFIIAWGSTYWVFVAVSEAVRTKCGVIN